MKKWWSNKTKSEKKWFFVKIISTISFLILGLIFGILYLAAEGWSLIGFFTNPTVDLILLILAALVIFCFSFNLTRRKE